MENERWIDAQLLCSFPLCLLRLLPAHRSPSVSEAYANYECLGWYSSGAAITPYDYILQKQVRTAADGGDWRRRMC